MFKPKPYEQVAFTKATPSSLGGEGKKEQSEESTYMGKKSMMSVQDNEYSDLEGESDDNNNQTSDSKWRVDDDNASPIIVKKYGVGALLMKKMGYKEGEGLGAQGKGIVNPIETRLRPQGLGIGGIREKDEGYRNEDSEDDNDYKAHVEDKHKNVDVILFQLIEDLSLNGIEVPIGVKEMADNMTLQKVGEEGDNRALEVVQILSDFKDKWLSTISQDKFISYQLDNTNTTIHEEEEGLYGEEKAIDILKSFNKEFPRDQDGKVNHITEYLYLMGTKPLNSLANSSQIFTTMAFPYVFDSFEATDLIELSTSDSPIIKHLANWATIYKNYEENDEGSLCYWDSMIANNLSKGLNRLFERDEDHDKIIGVLSFWLESPILMDNKQSVSNYLVRNTIIPQLNTEVDKWDVHDPEKSSQITHIIDYVTTLSIEKSDLVHSLLAKVSNKYETYVSDDSDESFWRLIPLQNNRRDFIRYQVVPELNRFSKLWSLVFTQLGDKTAYERVKEKLLDSVLYYLNVKDYKEVNEKFEKLDIAFILFCDIKPPFYDYNILNTVLQFLVFNYWISQLKDWLSSPTHDKSRIKRWYNKWYFYVQSIVAAFDFHKQTIHVFDWYFNRALQLIEDHFEGRKSTNALQLPSIDGDSFPSIANIKKFKSDVIKHAIQEDVNGIPSYKLITSFKDVVSLYCLDHNILLSSIKGMQENKIGRPLFQLQNSSGHKISAYIDENVLWISPTLGHVNEADFFPINIDELYRYI